MAACVYSRGEDAGEEAHMGDEELDVGEDVAEEYESGEEEEEEDMGYE